jgi:replicative DNA helicase
MSAAKDLGVKTLLEKPSEKEYLRAIMHMPVHTENVRRFAARIRKLEIGRLLNGQLDLAKQNIAGITGDEPIDEIIAKAEGPIFDFSSLIASEAGGAVSLMGEGAEEYLQYLMDNPREMMGISTGLARYDRAIGGGIRANSVDIIAARPKVGKTQLVDNIGLHVAGKVGVPTFNLDTEMTKEEHLHRIAGNLAGVAVYDIETGKVGVRDHDRRKVLEAAKQLKAMPYYYQCIIGSQFEDVLASMRRWVTRTVGLEPNGKAKPCVVIYDYLKMMSADFLSGDLQEYQALGFIATALKNFMGRYGVGCLCFAQLNREGIDREDTGVISGSDRIIHYCTSFSIYKWKSDEERAEPGEASKYSHKLIPIINRHGEGLKAGNYINIQSNYRQGRVTEGPTRDELASTAQSPSVQGGGIVIENTNDQEVSFVS